MPETAATDDESTDDPLTFGDGDGEKNIDPTAYRTNARFQSAINSVVDTAPSWIETMKFEIIWRKANGKPIPDHLQPLLKDDDPDKDADPAT